MDGRYENRGNREKGKREGRIEGIMKENRWEREKGRMDWWIGVRKKEKGRLEKVEGKGGRIKEIIKPGNLEDLVSRIDK